MNKMWIKNTLLAGLPSIIGVLGVLFSIEGLLSFKGIILFLIIILTSIHIYLVIYYSKIEQSEKSKSEGLSIILSNLNKISNANAYICSSIIEITEPWVTNINKISKDIINKGEIKESDWNILKIYKEICISCRNMIKEFTGVDNNSKVSVGFISYYEMKSVKWVKMVAHSNPQSTVPRIFGVEETLDNCAYMYAKLIKQNNTGIFVLENNQEILKNFNKTHDCSDLSKYTQYIAVPVFCNRNKLLGILQIITQNGYTILDTKEKLYEFGEKFILPYTELLLLADKIEKIIFSKPKDEKDEKGEK